MNSPRKGYYMSNIEPIILDPADEIIVEAGVKYATKCATYIVGMTTRWLEYNWECLTESSRTRIKDVIEEEVARRESNPNLSVLSDIDTPDWVRLNDFTSKPVSPLSNARLELDSADEFIIVSAVRQAHYLDESETDHIFTWAADHWDLFTKKTRDILINDAQLELSLRTSERDMGLPDPETLDSWERLLDLYELGS